jgi:SAM-dependent methyltransferase
MSQPDYGLDAPKLVRRFAVRGLLLGAFAVILYLANRGSGSSVAPLASALFLIGLAFAIIAGVMVLSSRVAKVKVRDRILDSIPWRGDENVLDVGCGRGLFLIGAAKRLKGGRATGVDIWQPGSGNTAEAAVSNAKAEGVSGRIKIETADARRLPFATDTFDIALSSLAIHNISAKQERAKALAEIARVLKPGGYLAIFDIFHTGEYRQALEQLGFTGVRLSPMTLLWCVPTRTLTARKAS